CVPPHARGARRAGPRPPARSPARVRSHLPGARPRRWRPGTSWNADFDLLVIVGQVVGQHHAGTAGDRAEDGGVDPPLLLARPLALARLLREVVGAFFRALAHERAVGIDPRARPPLLG